MIKTKKLLLFIGIGIVSIPVFIAAYYCIAWKQNETDPHLSKNPIFKAFDRQKQKTLFVEQSEDGKSNNLIIKTDTDTGEEFYTCYINDNKLSLDIKFSVGDGLSGGGYELEIIKNRHQLSPYHYTDVIRPFDFLDTGDYFKILDSRLVLNQDSYKKGDSIFGYTSFKIQKRYGPEKYIEEGKGYFKGIVN
ncbi:hypothetical protein HHL23_19495 [Chryseobacterium sp. RP-3-3]|uniref:Uncharacterized protein n=1 Tax=Chryseobacterium antibioticum TaxID=2728847 RepID=A0A7Y0AR26_9FLAO|nr:hypothetical protein [Chryseobacterium antibioticum]NML71964.1 hypothetical protein [Chryseobacterium antibioticum]